MIRNDLSSGSLHVSAVVHGDGLTLLQYRRTDSTETEEVKSEDHAPDIIQLERSGNNYYMSTASDLKLHLSHFSLIQLIKLNF